MKIRSQYNTRRRIIELVTNLKEIENAVRRGHGTVGLSQVAWITPISFLPIVVYASRYHVSIDCAEKKPDVLGYLGSICFPEGTTKLSERQKNFLPITRLSCNDKNNLLSKYEDRILCKVHEENRSPFSTSLKYLTSELESNVREHADVDDYWIFAQYWPRMRTCEIAMCDTGIGYKDSYVGTMYEVANHIDAIKNALEGRSSKSLQERGAGIPSIVRMFVEGYQGEMVIMSGDSLLHAYSGERIGYKFSLLWPGSFVGLRFRLREINIYDYL